MGTNYFRRDARDIEFMLFEHLDVGKLISYEVYRYFSVDELTAFLLPLLRFQIDRLAVSSESVLSPAPY